MNQLCILYSNNLQDWSQTNSLIEDLNKINIAILAFTNDESDVHIRKQALYGIVRDEYSKVYARINKSSKGFIKDEMDIDTINRLTLMQRRSIKGEQDLAQYWMEVFDLAFNYCYGFNSPHDALEFIEVISEQWDELSCTSDEWDTIKTYFGFIAYCKYNACFDLLDYPGGTLVKYSDWENQLAKVIVDGKPVDFNTLDEIPMKEFLWDSFRAGPFFFLMAALMYPLYCWWFWLTLCLIIVFRKKIQFFISHLFWWICAFVKGWRRRSENPFIDYLNPREGRVRERVLYLFPRLIALLIMPVSIYFWYVSYGGANWQVQSIKTALVLDGVLILLSFAYYFFYLTFKKSRSYWPDIQMTSLKGCDLLFGVYYWSVRGLAGVIVVVFALWYAGVGFLWHLLSDYYFISFGSVFRIFIFIPFCLIGSILLLIGMFDLLIRRKMGIDFFEISSHRDSFRSKDDQKP